MKNPERWYHFHQDRTTDTLRVDFTRFYKFLTIFCLLSFVAVKWRKRRQHFKMKKNLMSLLMKPSLKHNFKKYLLHFTTTFYTILLKNMKSYFRSFDLKFYHSRSYFHVQSENWVGYSASSQLTFNYRGGDSIQSRTVS